MRTEHEIRAEKAAVVADVQRQLADGVHPTAIASQGLGARARALNRELLAAQGREPYVPLSDLGPRRRRGRGR